MVLNQDNQSVTGDFYDSNGNQTDVEGTLESDALNLVRDTGLSPLQIFKLQKDDSNHYHGTYFNKGGDEKYADSGSVTLSVKSQTCVLQG